MSSRGQTGTAVLLAPQRGFCSTASAGCAWWLYAARHSQKEAGPPGAQSAPRGLQRAASQVAGSTGSGSIFISSRFPTKNRVFTLSYEAFVDYWIVPLVVSFFFPLQAVLRHAAAACVTRGCSLHYIRLQPALQTVAGCVTYDCRHSQESQETVAEPPPKARRRTQESELRL